MERRQSRRDMRICMRNLGGSGGMPPPPRKFVKNRPKSMQLVRFLTHLSNFYKSTESTFYSLKLFTHENFFLSGNTVGEKRKSAERQNNYRLWTIQVVTFRLCGWCMLGVFLLSPFTCLGHKCQTSVYTLIRKSFLGNSVRTHFYFKGQIPSIPEAQRRVEPAILHHAGQRA